MTNDSDIKGMPDQGRAPFSGQSVAVAVASGLLLFTVVGLVASRTPAQLASPTIPVLPPQVVTVPAGQQVSASTAPLNVSVPEDADVLGGGFSITVPAGQAVALQGFDALSSTGGEPTSAIIIPALTPGHHLVKVGMHEIMVTAVE